MVVRAILWSEIIKAKYSFTNGNLWDCCKWMKAELFTKGKAYQTFTANALHLVGIKVLVTQYEYSILRVNQEAGVLPM